MKYDIKKRKKYTYTIKKKKKWTAQGNPLFYSTRL